MKYLLRGFNFGEDSFRFLGKKIYYNTGLGSYAGYQAVLVEHMHWFSQLKLSKKPVLVDVGANVGYVSTAFLDLKNKAKVFCLEPSPVVYDVLLKNIEGYKNIKSYCVGLGSKNSAVNLKLDTSESSFSSLRHAPKGDYKEEKIKLLTLDTFCKNEKISKIDILKLDVEGYELEVLKGAKKTLKNVKYLHVELNTKDYLLSDLCTILRDFNITYNLKYIRNFNNVSDSLFNDGDMLLELNC